MKLPLLLSLLVPAVLVSCRASQVQGLDPIYPAQLSTGVYTDIDTLHPTFAWKAFPGDEDEALYGVELVRLKNIRYDLVVYRATTEFEKVHERLGLTETEHRIPFDLEPDTTYLWSVRTRFELDGQTRVTPWSTLGPVNASRSNPRRVATVPNPWLFRFETPRLGNVRR